jgi:hypothetical protein
MWWRAILNGTAPIINDVTTAVTIVGPCVDRDIGVAAI